jgi:hypothetical protein
MRAVLLICGFWMITGAIYTSAAHAAEPFIADEDQSALAEKLARQGTPVPALVQPCDQCRPAPVSDRGTIVERKPGAIPSAQRGTTGIQSEETLQQPLVSDAPVTQKIPGLTPSVLR